MINYHYLEKDHHPKAVTPERLAEFLASFPPGCNRALTTIHPRRRDGV